MGAERCSGWEIPKEVDPAEFSRETGQRGDTEVAVRHTTRGLLVLSPVGSIALCPGVPSGLVGTLQACREEEGRRRAGMELFRQLHCAPPPTDPLQEP